MQPFALPDSDSPGDASSCTAPWPEIEDFLSTRGAHRMPHPGGTLTEHLIRVSRRLREWGAAPVVQVAGLCHAAYGTGGFDQTLMDVTEREVLVELIGEQAEALVYLYASCDRDVVYPRFGGARPIVFRDRFTGREHLPSDPDVRAFLDITAANELDVLAHNADLAWRYGPALQGLFFRSRDLLSDAAWTACARQLGRHSSDPESGIQVN
ncbi:DUF6817 domain-containing protein [Kitasatospora aureofaciens]|uniref:DUF6817 domain-containing protein n=1 Tax=Kitasatospora aureofaciens TaxID=1894 RepID=UPI0036F4A370